MTVMSAVDWRSRGRHRRRPSAAGVKTSLAVVDAGNSQGGRRVAVRWRTVVRSMVQRHNVPGGVAAEPQTVVPTASTVMVSLRSGPLRAWNT